MVIGDLGGRADGVKQWSNRRSSGVHAVRPSDYEDRGGSADQAKPAQRLVK